MCDARETVTCVTCAWPSERFSVALSPPFRSHSIIRGFPSAPESYPNGIPMLHRTGDCIAHNRRSLDRRSSSADVPGIARHDIWYSVLVSPGRQPRARRHFHGRHYKCDPARHKQQAEHLLEPEGSHAPKAHELLALSQAELHERSAASRLDNLSSARSRPRPYPCKRRQILLNHSSCPGDWRLVSPCTALRWHFHVLTRTAITLMKTPFTTCWSACDLAPSSRG